MKEVEIKFLIADMKVLTRKLRELGFRIKTPRTREMNVLYDLPEQPLLRRGELLRIREYGDKWILTHKSKAKTGRHKSRLENETEIQNGRTLEAIFRSLGFTPSFVYEKFRTQWTDDDGYVLVDETPIGNVAEIEGKPGWIDRTAKLLGVERSEYITQSYAQIFFDWKERTGSNAVEMTWNAMKGAPRKKQIRNSRARSG